MKNKILLLALLLTVKLYSQAQTPVSDSVYICPVELQTIEIQALRATRLTPVAFTDISDKDISKQNTVRDMPYLIQNTPSVMVTSDAGNGVGYTDIRLRGVDASRINVTLDGVPLNDAEEHKVYWVDAPDLSGNVGSVQIQRGAGCSTNGAGAFGGSINMTTAAPKDDFGASVSLSAGSYNTNKQSVAINSGTLSNGNSFNLNLSRIHSDGYIRRAESDLYSLGGQYAVNKSTYSLKFITFLGKERTYNAWDGVSQSQLNIDRRYNSCGEILNDNGEVSGFYSDQTDNYLRSDNRIVFSKKFRRISLNITGHYAYGYGFYNQYKNDQKLYKYALSQVDLPQESDLTRKKAMENHFYGIVSAMNYKTKNSEFVTGLSANVYDGSHWGKITGLIDDSDFSGSLKYYSNNSLKTDFNVFAKFTHLFFSRLYVYLDLQLRNIDHEISGFGDAYDYSAETMQSINTDKNYLFFNPKAGISFQIDKNSSVFASFSVAQREPSRYDFTNAVNDDNNIRQFPLPELMRDYEAGYNFKNDRFALDFNLYFMDYDDQLILTGNQNTDTYESIYENVKDSYRCGIEIATSFKITNHFNAGGNLTLSKNIIENYTEYLYNNDTYGFESVNCGNSAISFSPQILAGAFVGFSISDFDAVINYHYIGKQYITNSQVENLSLKSYGVADFRATYSFNFKNKRSLALSLSLNNIFNTEYCSNAFGYSYIQDNKRVDEVSYFPQATFNFMSGLSFIF